MKNVEYGYVQWHRSVYPADPASEALHCTEHLFQSCAPARQRHYRFKITSTLRKVFRGIVFSSSWSLCFLCYSSFLGNFSCTKCSSIVNMVQLLLNHEHFHPSVTEDILWCRVFCCCVDSVCNVHSPCVIMHHRYQLMLIMTLRISIKTLFIQTQTLLHMLKRKLCLITVSESVTFSVFMFY